ncbi:putative Ubiquitin domain-containing protein [Helianthus annuus]|uniref:Putative ubiquitin-related domain-containing protein n=1 Tax=Helianthus annuus TaxID=4232 RepID=A0A251UC98_HELAN|nr:BAG family molecular chaperone regulator 2 [Helianthus annuus]KAF5799657.1 putative Ubiquitin domain-containing protein [Helianthus annuus]
MMKLKSKRLHRTLSKFLGGGDDSSNNDNKERGGTIVREINWELRPGGMLVQKREMEGQNIEKEGFILVRVAAGSRWHDISIQSTSTFGEMKIILSMVTGMEPKEQRVLFKGKEREDVEHLHMVGVGDKDKVLMLEDPSIKDRKLHGLLATTNDSGASNHAISV